MGTPWLNRIIAGLAILAIVGLVKAIGWVLTLFGME